MCPREPSICRMSLQRVMDHGCLILEYKVNNEYVIQPETPQQASVTNGSCISSLIFFRYHGNNTTCV